MTQHIETAPRRVRLPFSAEFIACTCAAVAKDDCDCIARYLDAQAGITSPVAIAPTSAA